MRGGSRDLEVDSAPSLLAPGWEPPWRQIVAHHDDHLRERVVRVDVIARNLAQPSDDLRAASHAFGSAGVWWNRQFGDPALGWGDADVYAPWMGGAALRFTFGSSPGIVRTIFADLRAGEFNFPPCTSLEVSAARWSDVGEDHGVFRSSWSVAVEIADGVSAESTPLIVTASRSDSAAVMSCIAPPGAYAFEVAGNRALTGFEDAAQWGVLADAGFEPVIRDYSNRRRSPPTTPNLLNRNFVTVSRLSGQTINAEIGEAPGLSEGAQWSALLKWFVR